MYAQSQDVVLAAVGTPVVGDSFQIVASTVPGPQWPRGHQFYVKGRPDLPGPVFTGRELTLQRNGPGGSWLDVPGATATVDRDGTGTFDVTANEAGNIVYRVVQEDYSPGRRPIGWFPSFPTPIKVAQNRAEAITYDPPAPAPTQARRTAPAAPSEDAAMLAARPTGATSAPACSPPRPPRAGVARSGTSASPWVSR